MTRRERARMPDKLFDEAHKLLDELEADIDRAIKIMDEAEEESPFGRTAGERDRTIERVREILTDLKAARNDALTALNG